MKTVNLYQYATRKLLATIDRKTLNAWCDLNHYLPHTKTKDGWIVIGN